MSISMRADSPKICTSLFDLLDEKVILSLCTLLHFWDLLNLCSASETVASVVRKSHSCFLKGTIALNKSGLGYQSVLNEFVKGSSEMCPNDEWKMCGRHGSGANVLKKFKGLSLKESISVLRKLTKIYSFGALHMILDAEDFTSDDYEALFEIPPIWSVVSMDLRSEVTQQLLDKLATMQRLTKIVFSTTVHRLPNIEKLAALRDVVCEKAQNLKVEEVVGLNVEKSTYRMTRLALCDLNLLTTRIVTQGMRKRQSILLEVRKTTEPGQYAPQIPTVVDRNSRSTVFMCETEEIVQLKLYGGENEFFVEFKKVDEEMGGIKEMLEFANLRECFCQLSREARGKDRIISDRLKRINGQLNEMLSEFGATRFDHQIVLPKD